MTDMVEHPPHYQTDTGLEAIEVIKAFFRTNYNLGQVFKYIAREGKKFDAIEDLKKARWYLDKEIEWREESPAPNDNGWGPKVGDRVMIETRGHHDNKTGEITKILDDSHTHPFRVNLDDSTTTYFHRDELRCHSW